MNIVDYYLSMGWRVTSDFGWRNDPFTGKRIHHNGIDFGIPEQNRRNGPYNIPVLTPYAGPVHAVGDFGDRGLTVVQHVAGRNALAVFQHLHRIDVRKGKTLKKGNSVGLVGSTGRSTLIHLHAELRKYSAAALGSGLWGNPRDFPISAGGGNGIMETVVLDPGHGGDGRFTKFGATGNGLVEKNLNLTVCRFTKAKLEKNFECKVVMTRNSDVDVSFADRAAVARNANAALLFSAHFNGFHDPNAHGFETFIYNGTLRSETINNQHAIHDAIHAYLSTLGIANRGKKRANFAILRLPPTSCVLAEYCFITNPREAALLKRPGTLESIGEATAEGIAKALSLPRKEVAPPPPVQPPSGPLPQLIRRVGIETDGVMTNEPAFLTEIQDTIVTVGRITYIVGVCNQRLRDAKLPPIRVTGHGDHIKIDTEGR